MKRRLQILITIGAVVLFCGLIYWSKQTGELSRSVLTFEPTYEGQTVSYWMTHWYQQYGQPNLQAHEAIRTMGANAAPYLGEMMAKRSMVDAGTPNFNYYEPLLQAFEVLGPDAQPATPYLIKSLGLNFNSSERALVSIGKGAVPPLADKLVESLSDTKEPYYYTGIRMAVRKTSGYFIRDRILGVLSQLGTNAEAALPALIQTVATNRQQLYYLREGNWMGGGFFADPYNVLARVGQNHPEIVVPILLDEFSNSSLPILANEKAQGAALQKRNHIIQAMKVFGTNQARVFLPVLVAAMSEKRTNDLSRIQTGDTLVEIGSDQPAILILVFLAALADQSNPESVRCAMAGYLAKMGTNQPDLVVPALKSAYTNASLYGRSSIAGALAVFPEQSRSMVPLMLADCERKMEKRWDNQWRIRLTAATKAIAPDLSGTLESLLKDLNDNQGGIRQQTISALGNLGTNALEAAPALLKCLSHPDTQTRIDATRALNKMGFESDEYINVLGDNLSCSNEFMVEEAEETLGRMAGHSTVAFITLVKNGVSGNISGRFKDGATSQLGISMRTNMSALLNGLESDDVRVRAGTLEVFSEFRYPIYNSTIVPEAFPKLRELAKKDPDKKVRERAADILWQQGQ